MAVGLSLLLNAIIENLSSFSTSLSLWLSLPLILRILMEQMSVLGGYRCADLKEGMGLSALLLLLITGLSLNYSASDFLHRVLYTNR